MPDRRPDAPCGPRLLAGWFDTGAPADHVEHVTRYGPLPREDLTRRAGRAELIATVERAGLRGRGGGGFPTAHKLMAVAAARGPRTVVANGCEGDPGSVKDRVLLELAPHLVLDGIVLAAQTLRARAAMLCVAEGGLQVARLEDALAERSDDPVAVRIVEVPERYTASEETALVRFLTRGDARPTTTPPRPAQRGVHGRPTLVDNVETLAHLALIARFGADWYRECGTSAAPGTTLVTLGGAIWSPGVYEVEYGTSLGGVLDLAGGPAAPARAVLVGGLGGAWLALPTAAAVPFTPEELRAAGARGGGVAALAVLPQRACGLAETARVLHYLATQSARQCGPCMFGLPTVAADLSALADGTGGPRTLARLGERLDVIRGRGACAHPDGAVALASSALDVFADDVQGHVAGVPCSAAGLRASLPVPEVGS
ncbi:MAG: proton-conducting membrane transporter [Pseudonocardia sp.]|nr:proton-conducting membrane transporter [Pseudonocardia sp.]